MHDIYWKKMDAGHNLYVSEQYVARVWSDGTAWHWAAPGSNGGGFTHSGTRAEMMREAENAAASVLEDKARELRTGNVRFLRTDPATYEGDE